MALQIGDVIEGKYRILRLLGEGGMGAVFEGENVRIKRRVAIKVLHAAVALDADATKRFEREAQAAGRIGNEHILEVLDLGELPDGDHFMVMEYLDGEALSERIRRRGKLSPDEAVPIFRQLLLGLKAAHSAGIVHRDLKPDNVFLLTEKMGQKDYVKIIDFGISKFQALAGEMRMTRTGTVMGTPYYMSPEQASGSKEADFRSDIYAVGVMLYEALSGSVPFDAPTFNQLLFRIVLSEPAPIRQLVPDLDEAFASIVSKAMARDMERRFGSADAFILALDNWGTHGLAVTVPPVASGQVYLPEDTRSAGTPGLFLQRPAAGTPAGQGDVPGGGGHLGAPAHPGAVDAGMAAQQRLTPGTQALEGRGSPGWAAAPQAPNAGTPGGGVDGVTAGAWVNTQTTRNKSAAPLILGFVIGILLLAGAAGAGWWVMFGADRSGAQSDLDAGFAAGPTVSVSNTVPEPVKAGKPIEPERERGPASVASNSPDASTAGVAVSAAISATTAAQRSKPAQAVAVKPAPQPRPEAAKPKPLPTPTKPAKPKKDAPIDFGY